MAYTRDGVPLKQQVVLRAIFTDSLGNPKDVDVKNDIRVVIYRPDDWGAFTDLDVEVAASYPNAFTVINGSSVTRIATGFYEATYTLPSSETTTGTWIDLWVGSVGGLQVYNSLTFRVVDAGTVKLQKLLNNQLVVVLLSPSIAGISGNTLGEEKQLTFSTIYSPYYASADLIRLECGPWLDGIPDDTISLMIHWSSIEADTISKGSARGRIFEQAKTRFVVYDTALRLLTLPADVGGKRKMLGDLLIETRSDFKEVFSSLKKDKDAWWRVVNAGGTIVPGQGLSPGGAIRGGETGDRDNVGRQWHPTDEVFYERPTQNSKFALSYATRSRFGYTRR